MVLAAAVVAKGAGAIAGTFRVAAGGTFAVVEFGTTVAGLRSEQAVRRMKSDKSMTEREK